MSISSLHADLIEKLKKSGVLSSKEVISAFKKVERENFVPSRLKELAYVDRPLPLSEGQTISQPTTVAIMTEALEPRKKHKILEIGSGSGFQTAILSEIIGPKGLIISLEKLPLLYDFGKKNLANYQNVEIFCSDGTKGYPYKAPFDRIIVAAEAKRVPDALIKQLKPGGILVIPINGKLLKYQKTDGTIKVQELGSFAFVPLVGEYE